MYDHGKAGGKPIKLLRMQVCAKAVKLLFYDLITAIGTVESQENNSQVID